MNSPADIFKSSLVPSTGSSSPSPFGSLLTNPGNSFGSMISSSAPTPKNIFTSSLQSSLPNGSAIPSGPQSKLPPATSGSNSAATTPVTPKSTYIASQTAPAAPAAPATPAPVTSPSTAPVVTPGNVNPNAAYQGIATPGNVDTSSPAYQYSQAFQTYLQSLQPTDAETTAEKALSDQQLQASKNQDTALEKPGQTLAFASGEAARVARNDAYQTDADSNTVNALTAARTARTTAASAGLDFEKSQQPSNSNFQLSPGETEYGPDGKPIATAPGSVAPKVIGDSTSGYFTVGNDGTVTPLLGATPPKLTAAQTSQQAYGQINQLLSMSDSNGVPYVDSNGYFTPQGFKSIVENAAEDGLTRAEILAQYGSLIYGPAASKYGLTPKEMTDLGLTS